MKPHEVANNLRRDLLDTFSSRRIRPTPQVIAAIIESIMRSSQATIGDSDSVLTGLLYSGSYTVDLLELAGANPRKLRMLAARSAKYLRGLEEEDENDETDSDDVPYLAADIARAPILEHAVELATSGDRVLETAHLLTSSFVESEFVGLSFPFHLRDDKPSSSMLQHWLEYEMGELLLYGAAILARPGSEDIYTSGYPGRDMISRRRRPISKEEDAVLDRFLGVYHQNLEIRELEFLVAALNEWFEHRRILIEPQSLCIETLHDCDIMAIAPELIYESGGNLQAVEDGLEVSRRFSPERDLAGLALFERGGRIHIGQYTYRNTFLVDTKRLKGHPIRRVGFQAVRPVSLISTEVIHGLESLLTKSNLRELEIQGFLTLYPEILEALGYAAVHPHICLHAESEEKLVPDFLLEIPGERGFDILDLKLPSTRIVARTPIVRMSSQLVKAVAQLRKYGNFFDHAENRKKFIREIGLAPFKPRLTVVIGRRTEFRSRDERLEIQAQMGDIDLLTYDDLIAYGKSRIISHP